MRTPTVTRLGLVLLCAGCLDEPAGIPTPPAIEVAAVQANPHNVLSAVVIVRAREADSVHVVYAAAGAEGSASQQTPAVGVTGDTAAIPVLGLFPATRYSLRVLAHSKGGRVRGDALEFTTGSLPLDLPHYTASGSDTTPGYVVFAASPYGLVIDNSGRVVWYRRFPNGSGLNFTAQQNGRYVVHPTTPDPTDAEPWIELDALGNVTRTLYCAGGLQSRLHDLIAEPDGSYWILCDEQRTMDLRAIGGVNNARVTGTAVHHITAQGALLFAWSPFDHFALTDVDLSERTGTVVNWTHGNALDIDTDGNLLLSFRNLGEITKVDVHSGAVLWRLGGLRNQFTFTGTATPAFSRQHGARAYGPGALLLLDNVGNPSESRAERYELDERARTARLVRSYAAFPSVVTEIGGSVQNLPGGRTFVSFGTAGRVEEYDASGRVVWRIMGHSGYVFRAQRIASLYTPGVATPR